MTLLPIILQDNFVPKVKAGDKIKTGNVLAEKISLSTDNSLDVSTQLGITPSKIYKVMVKNLGDKVEVGEVIAVKKNALGMASKKILSEFSGTIVKIDEEKGLVLVKNQNLGSKDEIISPVDGIIDICNNEKILIKTEKNVLLAEDSLGKETTGELVHLNSLDDQEVEGKILAIESLDRISLFKAISLGVKGIITTKIEEMDFIDLEEKRIKIPFALVNKENFEKIQKAKSKQIFLNGENKNIVLL